MITKSDISRLRRETKEAEQSKAQLEGRKQVLDQRLLDDFGVSTPDEVKTKLEVLDSDIEETQEKIDKIEEELEELFYE